MVINWFDREIKWGYNYLFNTVCCCHIKYPKEKNLIDRG